MDYKQAIIDNLTALRAIEQKNKQVFKVKAYNKVIKQINEFASPIHTIEDLSSIAGIGQGIKEKLFQVFDKGYASAAKPALENIANEKIIAEFMKIMGVGEVKARELVEKHNVMDLDTLRINQHLLNDKQRLGLKHHDDFMKRIPRKEMDKHKMFIGEAIPKGLRYEITGSYRRGLSSSGDIDVLVTCEAQDMDVHTAFTSIIHNLRKEKYLTDDFASGPEKYLGTCKLPRFKTYRRIDIMFIAPEKFAFALLYFTGSQTFNIAMRNKALEKGYSLSEHGFKHANGPHKGEFIANATFQTEQDIFRFIGMEYVAPHDRK